MQAIRIFFELFGSFYVSFLEQKHMSLYTRVCYVCIFYVDFRGYTNPQTIRKSWPVK